MDCSYCEYSLYEYARKINSLELLVRFLQKHGVFTQEIKCPVCKDHPPCTFYLNEGMKFVCTNSYSKLIDNKKIKIDCKFSVGITKGTIFEKTPYSLIKMCDLIALWFNSDNIAEKSIEEELGIEWKTVEPFVEKLKMVCLQTLTEESEIIGGPSKTVLMFSVKEKDSWYIGGFESDTTDILKSFITKAEIDENNHLRDILLNLINNWINPGSVSVVSDERIYNLLADIFSTDLVNDSRKLILQRKAAVYGQDYSKRIFISKFHKSKLRLHYIFKALGQIYPIITA